MLFLHPLDDVHDVEMSAERLNRLGIETSLFDPGRFIREFPSFNPDGIGVAALERGAGHADPHATTEGLYRRAVELGAVGRMGVRVAKLETSERGVVVTSDDGTMTSCGRVLIAAGPWTKPLAAQVGADLPLTVERQSVFWLEPQTHSALYDRARFPIYAYEYQAGSICYGFPRLPRGVKASVMHGGVTTHPDRVTRTVDENEVKPLRAALRPVLPGLAEATVRESGVCLFTNTPDHDFIVDFHPDYPQVLISSACSGHGFKFASAIGELQADLLTKGEARFDLSPFRIDRWRV